MRDFASNVGLTSTLDPAVQAATIKGAAVSIRDAGKAFALVHTGAIVGAGDFTAKLQESDTTTDADFTDVGAANLIGTFPATLLTATVVKVGYIGGKGYLRTVLTKNGGTSIAASSVIETAALRARPVA